MAKALTAADAAAPPLDLADFPGCEAIRIPADRIADYGGRIEYWEAGTVTAMQLCEPATLYHEVETIAASRRVGAADLDFLRRLDRLRPTDRS